MGLREEVESGSERQAPRLRVAAVAPGSPAERAGLQPGDEIAAVAGLVVRDQIDFQLALLGEPAEVDYVRAGRIGRTRIVCGSGEDLGISFAEPVPTGIRECNNHCEFCFIRGLPAGLRPSLYVRDDDYRYSFLFGNFLTLTNLDESDWDRIAFQRLGPLYVSVHATSPDVRRRMLANRRAPDILAQLDRLGRVGVKVHAQVVLCPGINDGAVLQQTVEELAQRSAVVESVAIVPVGLSDHIRVRNVRAVTQDEARRVIAAVTRWQRRFRASLGRGFVYASDELYLLAGRRIPAARRYNGYPQLQNGVGLIRLLLDRWARVRQDLPTPTRRPWRVVWVSGRAVAPALRIMAAELAARTGLEVDVLAIENRLFGAAISVSGLLAGRDVAEQARAVPADRIVVPRAMFGFEGRQTLDEWTVEMLDQALGGRVAVASDPAELVAVSVA